EIRDVMAYLTLVVNPADDIAAKRVINVPRRGVGKSSIEKLEIVARNENLTFLQAAELGVADDALRPASRKAIGEFVELLKEASTYGGDLRRVIEAIIEKSGIIKAYEAEDTDEARGRVENIKELLGVVDEYTQTHDEQDAQYAAPAVGEGSFGLTDAPMDSLFAQGAAEEPPVRELFADSLADFIEWVTLRTDLDSVDEGGAAVTMMTVHSSKGLEFDCVFVAGMEESLFPHTNSINDAAGIEEERRLAYVAITRARKRLYLTCATTRQLFGQTSANPTSRFIAEIPSNLRQTSGLGSAGFSGTGWEKRGSRKGIAGSGTEAGGGRVFGKSSASGGTSRSFEQITRPEVGKKAAAGMTFTVGDSVDHKIFGRGKVVKIDGDTLHIRFAKTGQTKKLLKDYAPIIRLDS
ncbi:MAG: 3'-5' exonuclease, partial [Raoultibacter sp.]